MRLLFIAFGRFKVFFACGAVVGLLRAVAFLGFALGFLALLFCCLPAALAFLRFAFGVFALPVWLVAYGVGLSLFSCRSICTAPVRGGTHFSLPPQRKVSKRKRAQTASL
jgi:hypothetical protein